jgi:2-hydroxy-6-oxo-6-(2'-carboxyphenyl)-hexa-2,4-dienoate hydrolase
LNFPGLAQHFRVLALDKLGQGFTDNPPGDEFTYDALLRHTARWLEFLGISSAHLVGHSRGGLLAAALAFEQAGLARTLIIVDSSTLAPNDPRWPGLAFYDAIERRIPPGPPTRETVRMEPDENSFSTAHVTDDFVGRYLEYALLPKTQDIQVRMKQGGAAVWNASLDEKHRQMLRRIEEQGMPARTLVVWGFNDPSARLPLGYSLFERIAAKTPAAELHVMNEAGHYTFREHPLEFNRLIRGWCLD